MTAQEAEELATKIISDTFDAGGGYYKYENFVKTISLALSRLSAAWKVPDGLRELSDKVGGGTWVVYNQPLRPKLSKKKIIEIQDARGNAIIPWSGFDDSAIKNKLAVAKFIVALVNAYRAMLAASSLVEGE